MEKAKVELKRVYEKYTKEGIPRQEAVLRAVAEVRDRHEREKFKGALKEFLEEIVGSYKPENVSEADPVLAFVEAAYDEWEILKAKLETLFKKRQ